MDTRGSPGAAGGMPSRAPGLLLGLGLGGFVDGILLHQVLQWHHMLTGLHGYPMTTVAGLEVNTLFDGFFHAVTWVCVLAGTVMTLVAWRQGRVAPTWSFHVGLVLVGWGLFNVVEGVVDHHVLGIHHVRDDLGGPLSWDIGFLALGVLLVAGGWLWHRRGVRAMGARDARASTSA
ncbi:MAG TPA: DUF2243 domain-containing protein [Nocardioidaceae bacterium]|nr:DUF2243 domain-containing protein [Nocardioidaceae bacterium]